MAGCAAEKSCALGSWPIGISETQPAGNDIRGELRSPADRRCYTGLHRDCPGIAAPRVSVDAARRDQR